MELTVKRKFSGGIRDVGKVKAFLVAQSCPTLQQLVP